MSRPVRSILWIGGVALVATLAAHRFAAAARGPALRYDTVAVDRGPVVARVTASGTLSALVTVQVGSQVSGRIQMLYVDYNSPVRRGELLAKIDPRLFQADLAQARADDSTARANLARAKAQAVEASLQYQRSRELAATHTSVAEADIGRIRAGMAASFTVDAYPGATFHGVVREVRNAPQTVQNVVTYDAVVDVDNPDLRLKPGMTANATFVYARRDDDVVRVRNAALRFHPGPELVAAMEGTSRSPGSRAGVPAPSGSEVGDQTVFVLRGERVRPVPIRTGVTDGTFSEVLSRPLRAGEVLVTDAQSPSASPGRRRPGLF